MMQSRFFQSVPHAKNLPVKLTSHQVQTAAELIHETASATVLPLVETQPKYVAVSQMLDQLAGTIDQLAEAQNQRRYKAVREMRGVGGMKGESGEVLLSVAKRSLNNSRAVQLRQIRRMVNWHLDSRTPLATQAQVLFDAMENRIKAFEYQSYEESHSEFNYLFKAIDGNPDALSAINALSLTDVYARMKSDHNEIKGILLEQTMLESKREEKPKIRESVRDVRHAVRVLLTAMHFDVEAGSPELREVLGQIDELIDRSGAVGERRKTIADKKAEKAKAADQADQNDQSDQDQTDSGNETPDSSDPQGQSAPDDQDGQSQTPQAAAAESQID